MNTGLKILYYKIKKNILHPDTLFQIKDPDKFPTYGTPAWKLNLKIYSLVNYIRTISNTPRLSEIHNKPYSLSLKVWNGLLKYNPNNLGNWSSAKIQDLHGTHKAEQSVVRLVIDLLGGKPLEWEGYITSGATESNLFSMWIARNNFIGDGVDIKKICVFKNDLTHYSVQKGADILNIDIFNVFLSESWKYDVDSIEKLIKKLIKKKYIAFIIPLTHGYAQSGTNDDYFEIIKIMEKLKKEYKIKYSIFIDAALSGLVLPFSSRKYLPLKEQGLDSFNLDFHKFGSVPLPCGLVLYKNKLKKNIELKAAFLHDEDSTISGSRTGIAAASALITILAIGKSGFAKMVKRSIGMKDLFIKLVKNKMPDLDIVTDKSSVTIGLISKLELDASFVQKYGLYGRKSLYHFANGTKTLYVYKATFIADANKVLPV